MSQTFTEVPVDIANHVATVEKRTGDERVAATLVCESGSAHLAVS